MGCSFCDLCKCCMSFCKDLDRKKCHIIFPLIFGGLLITIFLIYYGYSPEVVVEHLSVTNMSPLSGSYIKQGNSHYLSSTSYISTTHIPTLLFTTSSTTTTNHHRMLRVFAKSTLLVKKCSRLVLKKPFIPRIYLYTQWLLDTTTHRAIFLL